MNIYPHSTNTQLNSNIQVQSAKQCNEYPVYLGSEKRAGDFYGWLDRLHGIGQGAKRGDYEGAEMLHELAFAPAGVTGFLEKYIGPAVAPDPDLPIDSSEQPEVYREYRQQYEFLLKRMEEIAKKLPSTRPPGKKLNVELTATLIDRFKELQEEHGLIGLSLSAADGVTAEERENGKQRRAALLASPEGKLLASTILMLNQEILNARTSLACGSLPQLYPEDIYRSAYHVGQVALMAFRPERKVKFNSYLTTSLKNSLKGIAFREAREDMVDDEHSASLYARAGSEDRGDFLSTFGVSDEIHIGVPIGVQIQRLLDLIDDPDVTSERDRIVLKKRFGLNEEEQTLQEVGDHIGVTREAIRTRQANAIRRLRNAYTIRYAAADERDESIESKPAKSIVRYSGASFQDYKANAGTEAYRYRPPKRATLEEYKKKERKRYSLDDCTAEAVQYGDNAHLTFEQLQAEMPDRFRWFLEHDKVLREPQRRVMEDDGRSIAAGEYDYHGKRPTGTGKSVSIIAKILAANTPVGAEKPAWDAPTIVLAPRRYLVEDLYRKWSDPELFGLPAELAGMYHSQVSTREKREALQKPVLFTTYASFLSLVKQGILAPGHRPLIILDEAHRAKGEVLKPTLQKFFDKAHVQGWTASDTFADGHTIGYYLFGRKNEHGQIVAKEPFHVTTYHQAIVENREIAPFKNIIVESPTKLPPISARTHSDYSREERERIAFAKGRDEAAIRMYADWEDPQTHLKLRDMDSIWYCEGIEHAKKIQEKLDHVFGKGHALAVSGQTKFDALLRAQKRHRRGELPALTNADILIEGLDTKNTQLIVMLRPTRSPMIALQPGGRGLRLDPENPGKLTYILTMIDENMPDMRVFGEEAGGMFIAPEGMQFTTNPRSERHPVVPTSYPQLRDLKIISDPVKLEAFLKERQEMRAEIAKEREEYHQYLDAVQMASRLNRQPHEILKIYEDLEKARDSLPAGETFIRAHGLVIPIEEFKEDPPLRVHKNQLEQFEHVIGVIELSQTDEVKPPDFRSATGMAQAALKRHPNDAERRCMAEIYKRFAELSRDESEREKFEVEGIQARRDQLGYFKTYEKGRVHFFMHKDLAPQFAKRLLQLKETDMSEQPPETTPAQDNMSQSTPRAEILQHPASAGSCSKAREEFDAAPEGSYLKTLGGHIAFHQQVERNMSNHEFATAIKDSIGSEEEVDAMQVHRWQSNQELPSPNAMDAMVQVLIYENEHIVSEDKEQAVEDFYEAYERTKKALGEMKSTSVDMQELNAFTNKLFELRQQVGLSDPQAFADAINSSAAMDFPEHREGKVDPLLITRVHGNDHIPSNGMMLSMVRALDNNDPNAPLDEHDKRALYGLHESRSNKVQKVSKASDVPQPIVEMRDRLQAYFTERDGKQISIIKVIDETGISSATVGKLIGGSMHLPSLMREETLETYASKFGSYLERLGKDSQTIAAFKEDLNQLNEMVREEKTRQRGVDK